MIDLTDLDPLPAELAAAALVLVGVKTPTGSLPFNAPLPASAPAQTTGFTFPQPTPATVWTINHGLGRFPQVTVVDPTGRQLDADVTYTNANQVVVSGDVAFAGTAYLS